MDWNGTHQVCYNHDITDIKTTTAMPPPSSVTWEGRGAGKLTHYCENWSTKGRRGAAPWNGKHLGGEASPLGDCQPECAGGGGGTGMSPSHKPREITDRGCRPRTQTSRCDEAPTPPAKCSCPKHLIKPLEPIYRNTGCDKQDPTWETLQDNWPASPTSKL